MSPQGMSRNLGMSLTIAQRHEEPSAACHEELPPLRSSAAHGASSSQSSPTSTIRATQVASPVAAALVAFQGSTHTKPHLRGHKPSSLNSVSFSDFPQIEIYKPRLQEGLINVSQTLAILPKAAPRPWHRAVAPRRATTAVKARSERRLSRSRARARLCHLSHHSAEQRRDWTVMRD